MNIVYFFLVDFFIVLEEIKKGNEFIYIGNILYM